MTRGMWKCAGRADDGESYCFYELREIAGFGAIAMSFSIIPVTEFWGAK